MRTNHVKTGVQSTHKMSHTHNILQTMNNNNVQHKTDITNPLIYYICKKLVTILRYVKILEV
jgi:hypothetical protein